MQTNTALRSYNSEAKTNNIAVVGFGNIGAGVVDILYHRKIPGLKLAKIIVKHTDKQRPMEIPQNYITTNINKVLTDPRVDTIVELVGGIEVAQQIVMEALRNGKDVVTANKALIARKGREIFSLAAERGRYVGFRGTFVGCHPLLYELSQAAITRGVNSLYAVLSGTCNYILSGMARDGKTFEGALKEAQGKGYAESDPREDLDGTDSAYKLRILFRLISSSYETSDFTVEGIENITVEDIRYSTELGYSVKLLGVIEHKGNKYYLAVHPALLSKRSLLGALEGELNGIEIKDEHGIISGYCAPGAGTYPTAVAVVKDLVDIAENRKLPMPNLRDSETLGRLIDLERRYYLRLSLEDKVGALAKIAAVFAKYNISIAAVSQKETNSTEFVPVILTTHLAKERDLQAATNELDRLDVVKAKTNVIRIIELPSSSR